MFRELLEPRVGHLDHLRFVGLGAAVAFFITVLIKNSPAEIPVQRTRLFVIMVITSGGLAGFSIESMRQLQEGTTDEAYRRYNPHRGRRG